MEELPIRPWAALINRRNITLGVALLVVIIVGIGYAVYARTRANPQQAQQQKVADTVAAVGKLMVLPTDEQPVMATVADPEKLKDQPFFKNAKKGTVVLIYSKAKKAILYDPDAHRIIDVGPFSIGTTPTPAP